MLSQNQERHLERTAPDTRTLFALLIDILIVAAVFFGCAALRNARWRGWLQVRTVVLTCITVYGLLTLQLALYFVLLDHGFHRLSLGLEVAAPWVIVAGLLLYRPGRLKGAVRLLLLVLSPLFFVLAASAVWQYDVAARTVFPGKAAGMLPGSQPSPHRVIWIVFDELDGRMLRDARPARVKLSEFDRLLSTSVDATHVTSPATYTIYAIPSLLLGKKVVDTDLGMSELKVKFRGGSDWKLFGSEPNIFSEARAGGFNAGVSGWYYPYCRVLGTEVSDCAWEVVDSQFTGFQQELAERSVWEQAGQLFKWNAWRLKFLIQPFRGTVRDPDSERFWRDSHIRTAKYVFDNAIRMLRDRELSLVFIHLPIPHPPGIWDSEKQEFSDGDSNYIDNLQLADRLLGQMRRTLEETGDWDASTVLVSSDHPFRPGLWSSQPFWNKELAAVSRTKWQPRIPFLLKLPGQRERITYDKAFDNVISEKLLIASLRGQVQSAADAVKWLDANGTSR